MRVSARWRVSGGHLVLVSQVPVLALRHGARGACVHVLRAGHVGGRRMWSVALQQDVLLMTTFAFEEPLLFPFGFLIAF